eukprot:1091948-Pleurochrysis_carterae.AAC.1
MPKERKPLSIPIFAQHHGFRNDIDPSAGVSCSRPRRRLHSQVSEHFKLAAVRSQSGNISELAPPQPTPARETAP